MEYLVGMSIALGVSLCGSLVGFDRDRAFYATMTLAIASYYQLFAVIGGSAHALSLETAVFFAFALVAVIGFKTNLWLIVAALAGHGVFDLLHPHVIANPGVPSWWPMFCLTYDVTAALYLAWLLIRSPLRARSDGRAALPRFDHPIRPYVQAELDAAASAQGRDASARFRNLERAHVLSQISTREHVRVHWRMFIWAVEQRNAREIAGQLLRIAGAATKTAVGLVPSGNSGGADVSPFRRMPIAEDLAAILADAAPQSTRKPVP